RQVALERDPVGVGLLARAMPLLGQLPLQPAAAQDGVGVVRAQRLERASAGRGRVPAPRESSGSAAAGGSGADMLPPPRSPPPSDGSTCLPSACSSPAAAEEPAAPTPAALPAP